MSTNCLKIAKILPIDPHGCTSFHASVSQITDEATAVIDGEVGMHPWRVTSPSQGNPRTNE